jgi:Protein kinase domain/PEGA domain
VPPASAGQEQVGPGTLVNGIYRLVRCLAAGGMGEVWEGQHERTKGRVALKLLLPEMGRHREVLLRFQREIEVTSGLNHPNIVRVTDANTLPDGRPFLVMELLEGEDLSKILGPLSLPAVCNIIEQTAQGLHAAHTRSVIHRDLKPENVFLVPLPGSAYPLVKILDFGISKALDGLSVLTRTHTMMGTPNYMAPEQATRGLSSMDSRADQFSLAAIAYELLTGHKAFEGDGMLNVLYRVVHEPPAGFAALGVLVLPAVEAVVMRGLSKSPQERYDSVLEFAEALRRAANSVGVRAGPPRPAFVSSTPAATTELLGDLSSPAAGAHAERGAQLPGSERPALAVRPSAAPPPASGPRRARNGIPGASVVLASSGARLATPIRPDPSAGWLRDVGVGWAVLALLAAGAGAGVYSWSTNRAGRVTILTVPGDATVAVDDVQVPGSSPVVAERPPGTYKVSVFRAGYGRRDQNVEVRPGKLARLSVTLPRVDVPPIGLERSLEVPRAVADDARPAASRGDPALQASLDLAIPSARVPAGSATAPPPERAPITVPGPVPMPVPVRAKVVAGARSVAPAPGPAGSPASPGSLEILPSRNTNRPIDAILAAPHQSRPGRPVGAGAARGVGGGGAESTATAATLAPRAPGRCALTVGTRPWSAVWIDGKDTGQHTPFSGSIPCGRHTLVFDRPDIRLHRTETIDLRGGEPLKQSYALGVEPEPAPAPARAGLHMLPARPGWKDGLRSAADQTPEGDRGSLRASVDRTSRPRAPAPAESGNGRGPAAPSSGEAGTGARFLSESAIMAGMNRVKAKVGACYARLRVPGLVMVNVTIARNGTVASAVATGRFGGTPTGACVERAVENALFPPSEAGLTTPYPFNLR